MWVLPSLRKILSEEQMAYLEGDLREPQTDGETGKEGRQIRACY